MKNESIVKICKKCKKVLPHDYKDNYCEACMNKNAEFIKKTFKIVGGIAVTLGTVAVLVGKNIKKWL